MSRGWYFDHTKNRWYVIGRDRSRTTWYRILMQNHLGRELHVSELVHHINGDSTDDRIENLEITDREEHGRHHYYERERDPRTARFLAAT